MIQSRTDTARRTILSGVAAGIAGGVLLNLYLILTIVVLKHYADDATLMRFVASGIMGDKAAHTNPSAPLIGTLIFYTIAIVWGLGYAYIASTEPQLVDRPLISGVVFGITVFLIMQVVEMTVRLWHWNPFLVANSLVGHILCFGLPVAYVVARWPDRS